MTDTDLAEAARYEVELRERKYPALVASGKMTADEATVDYQAWTCILTFFETGQFQSIAAGGADERTVVDWVLAEDAATRALAQLDSNAEDRTRQILAEPDAAKKLELLKRRDALQARSTKVRAILRKVALRRQSVESINRQLREQRKKAA